MIFSCYTEDCVNFMDGECAKWMDGISITGGICDDYEICEEEEEE